MTDSSWNETTATGPYGNSANWNSGIPGKFDTGFFGGSNETSIEIAATTDVGGWTFGPVAFQYTFTVDDVATVSFYGAGITIKGGGATVDNFGTLEFFNNSTAGSATIINEPQLNLIVFSDTSTAG